MKYVTFLYFAFQSVLVIFLLKEAYSGSIKYMQILDEEGNVDQSIPLDDIDNEKIIRMYKLMVFARAVDSKVLSLQRQGRMATYGPCIGEEATQIGAAIAMNPNDIFVPNFRQHALYLARGMPLENFLLYWKGYEEGNIPAAKINGMPVIVPVGTQMQHAVGLAFAQKQRKTGNAVVAYVGDGGTSEGDFYEAMNFAGVMKVPVILIIENNGWAISVPRSRQSAAETLAQKAIAAGIPGVQVDGNDVFAVYKAVSEAIRNSKDGAFVIECITYRMSMHTTSDDPTKYRSEADVNEWKARDPILRLRKYLSKHGLWNDDMESKMNEEYAKLIDAAVEKEEAFKPDPRSMFNSVYSFMPQVLQEEMDDADANNYWR